MSMSLKKTATLLLTAAALLVLPAFSGAQYVEHWRQETLLGGGKYFEHSRLKGMTYNPVTDNVLVATNSLHTLANRTDVLVVSAGDGSDKTGMDTRGVAWGSAGGDEGLLKIAVVDRGNGDYTVYVCTATSDAKSDPSATGPGRDPFYLYRWEASGGAEESTLGPPTLIYYNQTEDATQDRVSPGTPIGPPLPAVPDPAFGIGYSIEGVYNPDTSRTKLYFGSTHGVTVMTVDEGTGTVTDVARVDLLDAEGVGPGWSGSATLDEEGNFYTTGGRKFSPAGAFLGQFPNAVLPNGYTGEFRHMRLNGRDFVGFLWRDVPPYPGRLVLRIADVTQGIENATVFSTTEPARRPSVVLWGDIALDTKRGRFIGLITGNMLVSFSQEEEARVVVADFAATVDEASGVVTVGWKTTLEIKNAGFNVYRLEGNDTTAGSRVNAALVPSISGGGGSYSLEDTVTLAPGATRGYLLENVDLDGNATAHALVTVTRETANSSVGEWALY